MYYTSQLFKCDFQEKFISKEDSIERDKKKKSNLTMMKEIKKN